MPRPIYIICAQSGAVDRTTGLESLFKVLEKVQFSHQPQGFRTPASALPFRMVAAWLRTRNDPQGEVVYESEIAAHVEGHDEVVVSTGQIVSNDAILRVTAEGVLPVTPGFPRSGLYEIECRIRPVGQQEWLRQSYPIIFEEVTPPPTPQPDATASRPAQRQPPAD